MNNKQFLEAGNYLVEQVKTRAEKGAKHFFDADSMRFFSSRISELCWKINDDIYFITSEANRGYSRRMWTLRKSDKDGDITTIGEFQEHSSLYEARKAMKEILEVKN